MGSAVQQCPMKPVIGKRARLQGLDRIPVREPNEVERPRAEPEEPTGAERLRPEPSMARLEPTGLSQGSGKWELAATLAPIFVYATPSSRLRGLQAHPTAHRAALQPLRLPTGLPWIQGPLAFRRRHLTQPRESRPSAREVGRERNCRPAGESRNGYVRGVSRRPLRLWGVTLPDGRPTDIRPRLPLPGMPAPDWRPLRAECHRRG